MHVVMTVQRSCREMNARGCLLLLLSWSSMTLLGGSDVHMCILCDFLGVDGNRVLTLVSGNRSYQGAAIGHFVSKSVS